jgi:hypothetical protein
LRESRRASGERRNAQHQQEHGRQQRPHPSPASRTSRKGAEARLSCSRRRR